MNAIPTRRAPRGSVTGQDFSRAETSNKICRALAPEGSSLRRVGKPGESGYVLLGVMILLALFVVAMAVTAPRIAAEIQRDREVETMHRGKQYIRAIQLYYRKFNAYPPSVDALVKTNEIRFLRKRYVDPLTGKDDWKTIGYCQNKAPIAMGFFGQPLGPTSGCGPLAGTGPSGGNGINGGSTLFPNQGDQNGAGQQNGIGQQNGGQQIGAGQIGIGQNGGQQNGGLTNANGGVDQNGNQSNGGGLFGDSNSGQTFGGGGIMGVSPASDKKSILVYKKKDHYNQWEFTYSTLMDQQTMMGGNTGTIGTPIGGGGINGGGGITGGGGGIIGGGGNGGVGPIMPQPTPPPQPPQQ
jgi:type II secretory pathway pseudopilin PulG